MRPKVFIIILNYNGWKDTRECLKSLEVLNYNNFEVIVVDNGSKEKLKCESLNFKIVQFFNKENLGFSRGNNIGIKYALENNTNYILLLNNDIIARPDFLEKLVKVAENDKKTGILGPRIYKYSLDKSLNKVHFAGGKINWLYTKAIHQKRAEYKQTLNSDYITGACMLIKRKVIDKIGLMPEKYFLYFEDVDWCLKAQRAGYKCVLVPNAKIWHKVSQSTKPGSFSYIYYHTRNGLLLAKRNAPFFIKTIACLNGFFVYFKQVLKLIIFPSKRKWSKAIMLGISDFYKNKFGKYENRN